MGSGHQRGRHGDPGCRGPGAGHPPGRPPGERPVRRTAGPASGLDSRAYRLPWPAGTTVFEIDQAGVNPVLPVESFLVISACGVEEYDETRWIAEEHRRGAWKFRQFLMAAEEVGYAQAGAAADALADFQPTPGGMGVVVVTMSDPYEWDEPSVGPHWCESYYRPQRRARRPAGDD